MPKINPRELDSSIQQEFEPRESKIEDSKAPAATKHSSSAARRAAALLITQAKPKPTTPDKVERHETLAPHFISPGMIMERDWNEQRGAKSAQMVIQQAAARQRSGLSIHIPSCPAEDFYERIATLPPRGQAFRIDLNLDLEAEALATESDYDDYIKELTNGRATAGRGEMWIATHFKAVRHASSDAPGSDGFIRSECGHIWELFSAKSCARSGIKLQLSALTTHGTRATADTQSLLDSIDLAHWQAIIDTTNIAMGVKLILFPSSAARDWVQAGLLTLNGMKAPRFYKLLSQSCEVVNKVSHKADKSALKASNAAKAKTHIAKAKTLAQKEFNRITRKEQLRMEKAAKLNDDILAIQSPMKHRF